MKVIRKKLGKRNAHGLAYPETETIEIDSRLKGRKLMEILIHEALHILNPHVVEEEIVRQSKELTKLLWSQQFRPVDNDETQPLQPD